jgi:MFS family permease
LIDSAGWRAIFWINVPVGLAALLLTALFVPESRAPHPRRLDPVGQVLVLTTLASLTYAIIEGPNAGWGAPEIVGGFALAAVALGVLLWWEQRRAEPLIELRFFRSASFTGATLIAVCAFAAFGGFLLLNTVYLQEVRGFSALRAGLYTLAIAAPIALLSAFAGRLVASRGPRLPLMIAGIGLTSSVVPLIGLTNGSSTARLLTAYVLFGVGFSMLNAPVTNAAVSGMPAARAGVAAAIASTSRQTGMALGIAVIGSAVTSSLTGPLKTSFAAASHVGWWIIMGLGIVVFVVGVATTGRWAERTAERLNLVEQTA